MTRYPNRFSADLLAEVLFSELGIEPSASLLVAYSGGCDSRVLLHALTEIRPRDSMTPALTLTACHADHGLHADSAQWAGQCAAWCRQLEVRFLDGKLKLPPSAGLGPEATARHARYAWLESLLAPGQVLLTAHHADDQAETLLLRLMRGSGVHGLAAMRPRRPLGRGELVRPLLGFSRRSLRAYARRHDLDWIEDPSNEALSLDRNYLRHAVLPPLWERWPDAAASIARSARHAATAAGLLATLAEIDLQGCLDPTHASVFSVATSIELAAVRGLAPERAANLLRHWIRDSGPARRPPPLARLNEALRQFLEREPCGSGVIAWEELELRCYRDRLYLLRKLPEAPPPTSSCEPGRERVLESLGLALRWRRIEGRGIAPRHLESKKATLSPRIGGERCRLPGRGGNRSLKKLYQEFGAPPWERDLLPLLMIDGRVAWASRVGACAPFAAGEDEIGMEPYFCASPKAAF